MDQDGIVAIGLLTQRDLDALGPAFRWAWPVDDVPSFTELLIAIDEAEERARAGASKGRPERRARSAKRADKS